MQWIPEAASRFCSSCCSGSERPSCRPRGHRTGCTSTPRRLCRGAYFFLSLLVELQFSTRNPLLFKHGLPTPSPLAHGAGFKDFVCQQFNKRWSEPLVFHVFNSINALTFKRRIICQILLLKVGDWGRNEVCRGRTCAGVRPLRRRTRRSRGGEMRRRKRKWRTPTHWTGKSTGTC